MSKLTMCVGLPASGKSTWAKEEVRTTGNSVRINRDSLRSMFFNSVWTGKREGFVKKAERLLATLALSEGYNPIIDDTNFGGNAQAWQVVAKTAGAKFEIQDFRDVPVAKCVSADEGRAGAVGRAVIYRMALFNDLLKFEPEDKPLVLVDLDGTLCDLTHRLRYIQQCKVCGLSKDEHTDGVGHAFKKDWDLFFATVLFDGPRAGVVAWVKALVPDYLPIIVSGRSDICQDHTVDWLHHYQIPYYALLMRSSHDHRDDVEVKEEFLKYLPKERIAFVIDDRRRVIEMWRSHGLKVYNVSATDKEY